MAINYTSRDCSFDWNNRVNMLHIDHVIVTKSKRANIDREKHSHINKYIYCWTYISIVALFLLCRGLNKCKSWPGIVSFYTYLNVYTARGEYPYIYIYRIETNSHKWEFVKVCIVLIRNILIPSSRKQGLYTKTALSYDKTKHAVGYYQAVFQI